MFSIAFELDQDRANTLTNRSRNRRSYANCISKSDRIANGRSASEYSSYHLIEVESRIVRLFWLRVVIT